MGRDERRGDGEGDEMGWDGMGWDEKADSLRGVGEGGWRWQRDGMGGEEAGSTCGESGRMAMASLAESMMSSSTMPIDPATVEVSTLAMAVWTAAVSAPHLVWPVTQKSLVLRLPMAYSAEPMTEPLAAEHVLPAADTEPRTKHSVTPHDSRGRALAAGASSRHGTGGDGRGGGRRQEEAGGDGGRRGETGGDGRRQEKA
jgi:hypothetical protein